MKYYLIAGEASGDLHAGRLMSSLREKDKGAEFRFFGGDEMLRVGGTMVTHYKEMAYMGFLPVLLHLPTIFKNISRCKKDILNWQPNAVILIDYPGFNLKIAKFVHDKTNIPVYYYISPKIWAWKEWRIKTIRRNVSELFSILPFEVPYYEEKHRYRIHYVGNPTVDEVLSFRENYHETREDFCARNGLEPTKNILALLAGSRKQEICDNLPVMLSSARAYCKENADTQVVIAGAPSIEEDYYQAILSKQSFTRGAESVCEPKPNLVSNDTYALLSHSALAMVTSGTATLETALFDVPQVVCYKTPFPQLMRWGFNHILNCKYISLVNLIAGREVVRELFADKFSEKNITHELSLLAPGQPQRNNMLDGYEEVKSLLGTGNAPDTAAAIMVDLLK